MILCIYNSHGKKLKIAYVNDLKTGYYEKLFLKVFINKPSSNMLQMVHSNHIRADVLKSIRFYKIVTSYPNLSNTFLL